MRVLAPEREDGAAQEIRLEEDLILVGDNADLLPRLPSGAFDLIYVDPPFNTGRSQRRRTLEVLADPDGDRTGFGGRRYSSRETASMSFPDTREDYLGFLMPRLEHARRLLADHGTLYVHLDYREAHYVKLALDELFGRECFLNELIWAYDYGAKPRSRWPAKHDTILVYVRDPEPLPLRQRGGRARALHGPGPRQRREGGARQAAHRRLVAHDRAHQRPREDRLPDAEARGRGAPAGRGVLAPRTAGAWTSSPGRARWARSAASWGAGSC